MKQYKIPEDQRPSAEEMLRNMSDRDIIATFANYNRELNRLAAEHNALAGYIRDLAAEMERRTCR